MAWNGSGAFTRTKNWQTDRDAATKILASRHDENDDELTTGIAACLTKNNESKPTATFSPNADDSYSIGATALRWVTLWLSTSLKIKQASFAGTMQAASLTANRTWTLPDETGTLATTASASGLIGSVIAYFGTDEPTGYLWCNGQAVSRATYAALFTKLSTTWGVGDGVTTFNLPDLRGRTLFGKDNMGGTAAQSRITFAVSGITGTTLGSAGGDQQLHAHSHSVTDPGHTHTYNKNTQSNTWSIGAGTGNMTNPSSLATDSALTGISIGTNGAGAAQNVPPGMICNWLIKT
jgi:microcystin-dependent protein